MISIIIPIIRREKADRCIQMIKENAGIPESDYEIVTAEDTKRIGCPRMVKKLVKKAKYDYICFIGDDALPQTDFLKNAIKAMMYLPKNKGLVGFNDFTGRNLATHWLCHKDLLPDLGGEFFHTGYIHCFCDNELMARCHDMGKYLYAYDAVIKHDHPSITGNKKDAEDRDYKRVYSDYVFTKDAKLFNDRLRNNWETPDPVKKEKPPIKILIGVPCGTMIHGAMAMDLVAMVTKTMLSGYHVAVVKQEGSIIEVSRNEMIETALAFGADYLFTVDSDMRFPPDTLLTLIAHNKSVVCCDASRRRSPFTSVVKTYDGNRIDYHKEELPELLKLKDGTSACTLIKTEVFKKLEPPYYAVEWEGKSFLGEDYYFTRKLRKAGIMVWCDTKLSLQIGHIGEKTYFINKED